METDSRTFLIRNLFPVLVAVLFTWEASPSDGVVGYRLFVGSKSGSYSQVIEVQGGGTLSVVVEVDTSQRKYAAVRAVNDWGMVSDLSDEVGFGGAPLPPFSVTVRHKK